MFLVSTVYALSAAPPSPAIPSPFTSNACRTHRLAPITLPNTNVDNLYNRRGQGLSRALVLRIFAIDKRRLSETFVKWSW